MKIGSGSEWHFGMWAAQSSFVSSTSSYITLNNLFDLDAQGRIAIGTETHEEDLNIVSTSGRSQIVIESDGAGGEASVRFKDTGTRNWTIGHWFDTGRLAISTTSNLSSGTVFSIDGDGNIGINGFDDGSGQGVVFIANATTVPSVNPAGGGILYVEAGALIYRDRDWETTIIKSINTYISVTIY